MANTHHAHVGAATNSTLLYDVGYLIDDVHEGYGTGCGSVSGTNCCSVRTYHFVSHASAATGLVDCGSDFGMVHDAGKGIWNAKNETGSELRVGATGVYETGSVGQEFTFEHDLGHGASEFFAL